MPDEIAGVKQSVCIDRLIRSFSPSNKFEGATLPRLVPNFCLFLFLASFEPFSLKLLIFVFPKKIPPRQGERGLYIRWEWWRGDAPSPSGWLGFNIPAHTTPKFLVISRDLKKIYAIYVPVKVPFKVTV